MSVALSNVNEASADCVPPSLNCTWVLLPAGSTLIVPKLNVPEPSVFNTWFAVPSADGKVYALLIVVEEPST